MNDVLAPALTLLLVVATLAAVSWAATLLERSARRLAAMQPAAWSDLATTVRRDADELARAIDRSRSTGFDGP